MIGSREGGCSVGSLYEDDYDCMIHEIQHD